MSLLDGRLSEDQRAFQDSARGFAQEQMAPFAAGWDADRIFPEEALRAGAALGFAGVGRRTGRAGGGAGG